MVTPRAPRRVAIVQRSVRRYRVAFYEALRAHLAEQGVTLDLLHSTEPPDEDERGDTVDIPWTVRVPVREWSVRGDMLTWQQVVRRTRDHDLVVVEQATRMLANYALLARQSAGGPKVAMWGHGQAFNPTPNKTSEWVKAKFSRWPWWWFAYNDVATRVVAGLGYPEDRITTLDNSSDTARLAEMADDVRDDEVAELRARIGVEGHLLSYVGSLVEAKDFDYLFAAIDALAQRRPQAVVAVAGAGPLADRVAAEARGRSNVVVLGPTFDRDLAVLLRASSLVLVPAWVGLVVTDCFAAGVPLIGSASRPHPPEVSYLRSGRNGLLVEDGGDPARYASAIADLLEDDERRAELAEGALQDREHFSAEGMAARFAEGVLQALALTERG